MKNLLLIILLSLRTGQMLTHGFAGDTLIKMAKLGYEDIELLHDYPEDIYQGDDCKVLSYDLKKKQCNQSKIKMAASSNVPFYVQLYFDGDRFSNGIKCSPIQPFYVNNKWVPAGSLKPGHKIAAYCNQYLVLKDIKFIKKPLKVYALEIKNTHTFYAGNLLTHNIALPVLSLNLAWEFGQGAASAAAAETAAGAYAGAEAGSLFGPVTITIGCVIGGIIGVGMALSRTKPKPEFESKFNADNFGEYFKSDPKDENKNQDKEQEEKKPPSNTPKDEENKKDAKPKTPNQEAEEIAKELGYKKAKSPPFSTHGKPAFKKGEKWISQDRDQHNGGFWKLYNNHGDRIGTYNKDLSKKIK